MGLLYPFLFSACILYLLGWFLGIQFTIGGFPLSIRRRVFNLLEFVNCSEYCVAIIYLAFGREWLQVGTFFLARF